MEYLRCPIDLGLLPRLPVEPVALVRLRPRKLLDLPLRLLAAFIWTLGAYFIREICGVAIALVNVDWVNDH